jgi:hypothetical protein
MGLDHAGLSNRYLSVKDPSEHPERHGQLDVTGVFSLPEHGTRALEASAYKSCLPLGAASRS